MQHCMAGEGRRKQLGAPECSWKPLNAAEYHWNCRLWCDRWCGCPYPWVVSCGRPLARINRLAGRRGAMGWSTVPDLSPAPPRPAQLAPALQSVQRRAFQTLHSLRTGWANECGASLPRPTPPCSYSSHILVSLRPAPPRPVPARSCTR